MCLCVQANLVHFVVNDSETCDFDITVSKGREIIKISSKIPNQEGKEQKEKTKLHILKKKPRNERPEKRRNLI